MKKLIITLILTIVSFKASVAEYERTNSIFYEVYKNHIEWLNWKIEVERRYTLIEAIIEVESENDPLSYNSYEGAAGLLQIRHIMVREVNRFVGYKKYTYRDRWDRNKSIEMFIIYQNNLNPKWDFEKAARLWNGGNRGHLKKTTKKYWKKVKKVLEV